MKKILSIFIFIISLFSISIHSVASPAHALTPAEIKQIIIPRAPADGASADSEAPTDSIADRLTEFAATLLGTRYVWGATGPNKFDCSGFTGYVFKSQGISLPRTSGMQYTQGVKVARNEWQPGDLLFFSSRRSGKGRVGHVAMVVEVNPDGSCKFIHASTRKGVVYQNFPDGAYYSRNYIGAKRIIDIGNQNNS